MAEFEVGSFFKQGTTGTQTITLADSSLTPKALILWASGGITANTWVGLIINVIGFSDGTNSYSVSTASIDSQTPSNTSRRIAAKVYTSHWPSSGAVDEADLQSFAAGSFTLDWTAQGGAGDIEIMYLVIGGDDVQAKVINWTSPTATGNKAVTGVGFQPDCVLHAGSRQGSVPNSAAGAYFGLGVMEKNGNQWANAFFSANGLNPSNTYRYQRTDKCFATIASNGSIQPQASFVQMDADGFTTNFDIVTSAEQIISLCLKGVKAKVGSFTNPTSATTKVITGVGFQPQALLFTGIGLAPTTSVNAHIRWHMGAGDGTRERTVALVDTDNTGTTEADSIWKNDKVIFSPQNGPGIIDEADLLTLAADGFTLDYTTADGVAREELYFALATDAQAPNVPTNLQVTSDTLDTTPNFSADASDPNGTQQHKVRFEVYDRARTTLQGTVDSTLTSGAHTAVAEFASALAVGQYSLRAKGIDDTLLESAYTAWVDFDIRSSVAAPDMDLLWDIRAYVSQDDTYLWDIAENATKSLVLLWNVRQNLDPPKDLVLLWDINTPWTTVTEDADIWSRVND